MKTFIGLILTIMSLTACSDATDTQQTDSPLVEFSASTSLSKFKTVTRHLSETDVSLASEIDRKLDEYKRTPHWGETVHYPLTTTPGKMLVNFDAIDTTNIWFYVHKDKAILLNKAYDSAMTELGF
jgi:hypothetical protein